MKVLFLTNVPSPYRVDFFNVLGESCELTVLFEKERASDRDTNWKHKDFKNFTGVFLKGLSVSPAEAFCPSVLQYLNKGEFDVIIVGQYSSPTAMLAIEYMRLRKISYILSTDGGFVPNEENKIKYMIKKHFISFANLYLSTSDEASKYLVYYGADESKITKYPFSSISEKDILNHKLTKYEKNILKEKLGITCENLIVSVGQFIHRKGYDLLIEAASKLNADTGVYIIGGEPTAEYIKMRAEYKADNVHFVGFLNKQELSEYYKAADLFVLPTREDVWGLVVNEAMAYGLPVITTDKCLAGVEMLEEGIGYIIPSDDVEELTKALLTVEKKTVFDVDKVLDKAKEYTIESMVRKHLEILKKIL